MEEFSLFSDLREICINIYENVNLKVTIYSLLTHHPNCFLIIDSFSCLYILIKSLARYYFVKATITLSARYNPNKTLKKMRLVPE